MITNISGTIWTSGTLSSGINVLTLASNNQLTYGAAIMGLKVNTGPLQLSFRVILYCDQNGSLDIAEYLVNDQPFYETKLGALPMADYTLKLYCIDDPPASATATVSAIPFVVSS